MIITLDMAKSYLRVDTAEDDELIIRLINAAQKLCMDVVREDDENMVEDDPEVEIAMFYALAYLYEHREEADHHELILTLRCLLFGTRKEVF